MLPLANKTIITTHPAENDDVLNNELIHRGATVISIPMIRITPTPNSVVKEKAFQALHHIDHILFTSKNGVNAFFDYAEEHEYHTHIRPDVHYYVIGEATAATLRSRTNGNIYISKGNTSTDFLLELQQLEQLTGTVLLALGSLAPNTLEKGLSTDPKRLVSRVNVYRTVAAQCQTKKLGALIKENCFDLITFTSPSAVERFINCLHKEKIDQPFNMACIGTTTANKVISYGIEPKIIASNPNKTIFVNEITNYLSTH